MHLHANTCTVHKAYTLADFRSELKTFVTQLAAPVTPGAKVPHTIVTVSQSLLAVDGGAVLPYLTDLMNAVPLTGNALKCATEQINK